MSGAYNAVELDRLEETMGPKARRKAVAQFDIRQRHLPEYAGGVDTEEDDGV